MVEQLKRDLVSKRADLLTIVDMIETNSKVLDLGCGDGSLLKYLREVKNVNGFGVEVDQGKIIDSVGNGVPVIHKNLNDGLSGFPDNSYDYVILSQTLQAVKRPDILLDEMLRVGRKVVISFINFGAVSVRLQLLWQGEMPKTRNLPDSWYDTPNIHLGTIRDFRSLCSSKQITIVKEVPIGGSVGFLARFVPNLFALTCVFVISKRPI